VPSFGGGLVPRVCDDTLWLAAEAGLPAPALGVPPGGGLSVLDGW